MQSFWGVFHWTYSGGSLASAALFYSSVDYTDASDMHHSNASLMHRWINRWIKQRSLCECCWWTTVPCVVTLEGQIQSAWQHLVFLTMLRKFSKTLASRWHWCLLCMKTFLQLWLVECKSTWYQLTQLVLELGPNGHRTSLNYTTVVSTQMKQLWIGMLMGTRVPGTQTGSRDPNLLPEPGYPSTRVLTSLVVNTECDLIFYFWLHTL